MEAKELLARADKLKSDRMVFASHWQEVADYLLPSREFTRTSAPGAKRMGKIFNTTPIAALRELAGGLHGMLTSPALRWFKLKPDGLPLGAADSFDDPATAWFEASTEKLYSAFNSPKAGFSTASHELYQDIGAFGNGCMFVGDGKRHGPLFHAVNYAQVFIACDSRGRVDTLFRIMPMTARQIMQEWPNVQSKAVREATSKNPERQFEVIHAVVPRPEKERGTDPFISQYVLRDGPETLEEGWFSSFPYMAPRWSRRSGEDYGNGPGMDALPDVKMLNKLEEINLRGAAKVVDPPLLLPDDGFLNPVSAAPGYFNYYRNTVGSQDRIGPLVTGAQPELGLEYINAIEQRIERLFMVTWLRLPTRPNMTATEVLQHRDEQLRLMGPMVSRLQSEFLGPLIERSFQIMWNNGLLPPAPNVLSGAQWEVEYLSPLALSQRTDDASSVIRWFQAAGMVAQADPSAMDVVDGPKVVRFLADRYGASSTVIRTEQEAAQITAAKQKQAAAAAEISGAQGVAKAVKDGAAGAADIAAMAGAGNGQDMAA